MVTKVKQLKVKIKSLADEARTIRLEEKRAGKAKDDRLRCSLREHRVHVVRTEQRWSLLAYAFLHGLSVLQVEKKTSTPRDMVKVGKLVERFGAEGGQEKDAQQARFKEWVNAAHAPA